MKTTSVLAGIFAACILLLGGNLSMAQPNISVVHEDAKEIVIRIEPGDMRFPEVQTPWGTMMIPQTDNGTYILKAGYPEFQKLTASVVIPPAGTTSSEIISANYYELQNIEIAPSKGNLTRNINPPDVPYVKGAVYGQDAFWPSTPVTCREPYIIREMRGQTIVFTPFAYNPVSKTLRIYTEITIKLSFQSSPGINELKAIQQKPFTYEFSRIYETHFLNVPAHQKYTPVEEDGNMLIICYGPFMTTMQPFVTWKNQKGIPTEIVDVATIGNAAAIKTYVANYYNTHGLTYLLLVGDHAQVPASSTSAGPSDNNYAYIVGNDHYPDIFAGRFSAETVEHVQTQVERSVNYEKYPQIGGTWYSAGTGIASEEGPGHNNLYDHEHMQLIRTKLLGYTYTNVTEHYEGTQGGLDLPGHPTASQVLNDINSGKGIINYTGHGWDQGWGTSGFSNTHVNQLTNTGQLPFIWSVACVNGAFTTGTCFGEAWLRASHNNQPTGAIGVMASTINQSWNPPMSGQLEMNDLLIESYTNNIKRSFGGISMNGCMKMNDDYGAGGSDMTDTWVCFGDPSLVLRTDIPGSMTVLHPPSVVIGTDNIIVQCNVNEALVALSINGQLIGRGYVSGGNANISFPSLTTLDHIDIVVTAFNKQTYLGTILVIPPNGPYVIRETVVINDATGNNNGLADFGENIQLHITLKNVGIDPANNVSATLSSANPNISLITNSAVFGNIAAGASQLVNNAFAFNIAPNITDQESVLFTIDATNGTETWTSSFMITLNAPVLSVPAVIVDDVTGNQNGRLDPGETAQLIFNTMNSGHATSPVATGTLTSASQYVTITNASVNAGTIAQGAHNPVAFEVTVDPLTPIGTPIDFSYTCMATPYSTHKQVVMQAGLIVEDWESNDFNSYTWVTSGNAPWIIVSGTQPFEGGFCARSGVIGDDQQSILSVTVNVISNDSISFFKKVSCENGSQWGSWWDYLVFHIDNSEKGRWDGEINWSRESYYVTAGSRTFKWSYIKDYIVSEGEDAAWIDFVVFPPLQTSIGVGETPNISHYVTTYPNPACDLMTINMGLAYDDIVHLSIVDATGKVVQIIDANLNLQKGSYNQSVSVQDLATGNYFLVVVSKHGVLSHPFVIVN